MKLVPKNWKTFQHYKERKPPWIKLHRALLDDRTFQQLPVESRALAPMLWLLAAESTDGAFEGAIEDLAFRLRVNEQELLAGLEPLIAAGFFVSTAPGEVANVPAHQPASAVLAPCTQGASAVLAPGYQPASPEAKAKAKAKGEGEGFAVVALSETPAGIAWGDDLPYPCSRDVVDAYHEALPELPRVKMLTSKRDKAITKLWHWVLTTYTEDGTRRATDENEAVDWIQAYFQRVRDNDFLMGRTGRTGTHAGWQCDFDFLLTERGMCHVIEKTEARHERA